MTELSDFIVETLPLSQLTRVLCCFRNPLSPGRRYRVSICCVANNCCFASVLRVQSRIGIHTSAGPMNTSCY